MLGFKSNQPCLLEKERKAGNFYDSNFESGDQKDYAGGLVDTLTCPIVWLPTYSEEQAFYERL
jgi:hypothetical protein